MQSQIKSKKTNFHAGAVGEAGSSSTSPSVSSNQIQKPSKTNSNANGIGNTNSNGDEYYWMQVVSHPEFNIENFREQEKGLIWHRDKSEDIVLLSEAEKARRE